MPTYSYICNSCGNKFEKFQSILSSPVNECPSCGEDARRQITGGSGFIMKSSSSHMPACASEGCRANGCANANESCAMAEHCH